MLAQRYQKRMLKCNKNNYKSILIMQECRPPTLTPKLSANMSF